MDSFVFPYRFDLSFSFLLMADTDCSCSYGVVRWYYTDMSNIVSGSSIRYVSGQKSGKQALRCWQCDFYVFRELYHLFQFFVDRVENYLASHSKFRFNSFGTIGFLKILQFWVAFRVRSLMFDHSKPKIGCSIWITKR